MCPKYRTKYKEDMRIGDAGYNTRNLIKRVSHQSNLESHEILTDDKNLLF